MLVCQTISSVIPTSASPFPTPPKNKTEKKIAIQPHPQSNQNSVDLTGKQDDKTDVVVREWDGALNIEASLIYWAGDERTVSLALAVTYPANQAGL
jgi:hypothetical protein